MKFFCSATKVNDELLNSSVFLNFTDELTSLKTTLAETID